MSTTCTPLGFSDLATALFISKRLKFQYILKKQIKFSKIIHFFICVMGIIFSIFDKQIFYFSSNLNFYNVK